MSLGPPPLPDHDYLWDPPAGLDGPTLPQPVASPTATTTYTLTVTSQATGCSASDITVVNVWLPPLADAGPDRPYCLGAPPPRLGTPAQPSLIYRWTPATGLDDPFAAQPVATPASDTSYTLEVTDAGTGCLATDSVFVSTGGTSPQADAGPDAEGPVVIGPAACDPALEYSWSPAQGLSDPSLCNPLADPAVTTTYCVVAREPAFGCESEPSCVTVNKTCLAAPDPVVSLVAVKELDDVRMSWDPAANADGGYRAYRVSSKSELALPPSSGLLAFQTAADAAATSGGDAGAVAPPPANAATYFYLLVGVCRDGVTEGP